MDTPNWFLSEISHAGDEHLDRNYALNYDRKASTDPHDDLALLRDLGLDETHTLVDFGAGTGTFALAAAAVCRRVIAIDVSPAMLALLQQKATQSNISNVECVCAGFLTYEHQGELADFVYTRNALHHLPDFWKALALARIAAVLKAGGVLRLRDLVFSCEPGETAGVIDAWLANASERPDVGWTRAELETHIREEHSTFSWILEPMLVHAGFEIQQQSHSPSGVYSAYVAIKL